MPTYRVFYAERKRHGARDWMRHYGWRRLGSEPEEMHHEEVEWEEEVEARNEREALDAFFGQHVSDRSQVRRVREDGESQELRGLGDYEPEGTYIWIEGDKLMEYLGMDEATPGTATCPLCGGAGEVEESIAEEFLAAEGEEAEGSA